MNNIIVLTLTEKEKDVLRKYGLYQHLNNFEEALKSEDLDVIKSSYALLIKKVSSIKNMVSDTDPYADDVLHCLIIMACAFYIKRLNNLDWGD